MFFGGVEHTRAEAHTTTVTLQNIEINTAFAAFPERFIVGELVESYGTVAQLVVHLHDGGAGGQTENFRLGESLTRQLENSSLYTFCKPDAAEFVADNQTGIGNKLLVAPTFNVTKTGKTSFIESNNSLMLKHLLLDIVRTALGNTGAAHLGGTRDGVENLVDVFYMFLDGDDKFAIVYLILSLLK